MNMTSFQHIENDCLSPARKGSLVKKLIEEGTYLMDQENKHLSAMQKLAANTPISQKYYDSLLKEVNLLNKNVGELLNKPASISYRTLVNNN